jgi:hypothetical protein
MSTELDELRRQVYDLSEVVTKLQEELRRAARYQNDSVEVKIDAIQNCLERAASVQSRNARRRRRN